MTPHNSFFDMFIVLAILVVLLNILGGIIRIVFTKDEENKILSILIINTSFAAFTVLMSIFLKIVEVLYIGLITGLIGFPVIFIFVNRFKKKVG